MTTLPPTQDGLPSRTDDALIRAFVKTRSEAAFTELGRRYMRLIHATCLRETGDAALAEDATQSVLLLLSHKAHTLGRGDALAGWLYAAARNVSRNLVRQERRRRMNETQAFLEAAPASDARNPLWDQIEPLLHEALDRLRTPDREAVLRRFVQGQSLAEVGAGLGVTENTARMRVTRALERVRSHLSAAGVAVSAAALAALLLQRSAQALPESLTRSLAHVAGRAETPGRLPDALRGASPPGRGLRGRPMAVAGVGAALLLAGGFGGYRLLQAQTATRAEQARLFRAVSGGWAGTLEYADDGTGRHYTYPTQVTITATGQGDSLSLAATYTGAANTDVTTFTRVGAGNRFRVGNGGPRPSHGLSGEGGLVTRPGGGFAFEGRDAGRGLEVRLSLVPAGPRLTVQEEFRASPSGAYRFRNRFSLHRAVTPPK